MAHMMEHLLLDQESGKKLEEPLQNPQVVYAVNYQHPTEYLLYSLHAFHYLLSEVQTPVAM